MRITEEEERTESMTACFRYFKPEALPGVMAIASELLGKQVTTEEELEDCEFELTATLHPGCEARIRFDENDHPAEPAFLELCSASLYVTEDRSRRKSLDTEVFVEDARELFDETDWGPDVPDYDDWQERQNELMTRDCDY